MKFKLFIILVTFFCINCSDHKDVKEAKEDQSLIQKNTPWSELKLAISQGNADKFAILIEDNKDCLNRQDKLGMTLLMMAAANGKEEIVKILIENKADASLENDFAAGKTALALAVTYKHQNIVKMLADYMKE